MRACPSLSPGPATACNERTLAGPPPPLAAPLVVGLFHPACAAIVTSVHRPVSHQLAGLAPAGNSREVGDALGQSRRRGDDQLAVQW